MEIQDIIGAVVSHVQDAPEKIGDFVSDPAAAIESLTGEQLDADAIKEVAAGVLSQVQEHGGDVVDQLQGLLGDSPIGDAVAGVSDLLGGLFGKK